MYTTVNWLPANNHNFVITSILDFMSIPSLARIIYFATGVGNEIGNSMISLDFRRFVYLKEINIGSNALNGVNELIATNLTQLNSMNVGEGSLTNIEK